MRKPPKPRPMHKAKHIAGDGRVSPLCAKTPRSIDMTRATWTTDARAVTCPRCLTALSTPAAREGTGRHTETES
jgi:hypothetical protein